jgi:hypothetical protein
MEPHRDPHSKEPALTTSEVLLTYPQSRENLTLDLGLPEIGIDRILYEEKPTRIAEIGN